MTREEIYSQMTGTGESYIGDEFQPGGACYDYYYNVYEARERLAERTGIDFEDEDIMAIVENMEKIVEICSYKMFDYGIMIASKPWELVLQSYKESIKDTPEDTPEIDFENDID